MIHNHRRPHTTLDNNTPEEFHFDNLPALRQPLDEHQQGYT